MSGRAGDPRVGSVVTVDGVPHQLQSLAAPSGWWAIPTVGGAPVRVRLDRRQGAYRWLPADRPAVTR